MLQYSIHFVGFDAGWLALNARCITKGMVKSKLTSCCCLLLTIAEPGHLHQDTDYLISLVFLTQMRKENICRKKIVSSEYVCCLIYPCPYWGQSIFVTVSKYIVSNQLIAGSIMARHMILVLVLSLLLRVYYLMMCTHNALWSL